MRFVFALILLLFNLNIVLSQDVILNPKGVWMLHRIEGLFSCDRQIDFSITDKMINAELSSCDSSLLIEEKLRPHFYKLFWHGIENNSDFNGINIPSANVSWEKDQMGFAYIQQDTISIFGRDFVLLNDSTYKVERKGKVIVPEFKMRYLDNCIYKTDTLNVVSMVQQWGTRWRISAPCSPFYLSMAEVEKWSNEDKWDYYALPCERNGKIKMRAIALSNDGLFRWDWGLGSVETLSAGNYSIENDSILILQSNFELIDEFIEEYKGLFPDRNVVPKYLIQRKYVLRDEKIYFINEYQ